MKLPGNLKISAAVAGAIISLSLVSINSIANWPTEEEALVVAEDLQTMITVGTSIVSGLQPAINAGQPDPAMIEKDHLLKTFLYNYERKTGSPLDTSANGLLGESRREFFESLETVLDNHEEVLSVGGVDSFVPAYFRSEVFAEFNNRLGGRVKGYATNREDDLLNPDWAIDVLMDYSLFAYYIQERLEHQEHEQLLKRVAGRVVGYYPMTLKPSCVACHARQGLDQEVGAFGGALITEVLLSD